MNNLKYVGLDVHQASTSVAVHDSEGKVLMQSTIKTTPEALRDLIRGLSGSVHVTFEEGTQAAWLYDLIKPLVAEIIVCDPRRNRLLKSGNKGDRVDANKLAQLLRGGLLNAVYHGENSTRTLKELAHLYDCLVTDTTRVMNRIKALYRSRAVPCAGRDVYHARNRDRWLAKLSEPGVCIRATFLYQELDQLRQLRRDAKNGMLKEARRSSGFKILLRLPALGPIRVPQIIASVGSPYRFHSKRQFWAYCGLAVVTRSSDDYRFVGSVVERRRRVVATRGLNQNFNRRLKRVFKAAALDGASREPFLAHYQKLIAKGIRPELARLTLARKIAAVALAVWKKGDEFVELKLGSLSSSLSARS
ncbi:MAG: hypothetical protein DMF61_14365 [Blastocatellia bacterium AA13]|nr:MAG: hypothetical protein DMF61_14365 [Blastocatellia bacterium AA13]